MYNNYAHTAVDFVQTAKRQVVQHTVKHEGVAKVCYDFIDAQTQYTKSVIDAALSAAMSMNSMMFQKDFGAELARSYGLDKFIPGKNK